MFTSTKAIYSFAPNSTKKKTPPVKAASPTEGTGFLSLKGKGHYYGLLLSLSTRQRALKCSKINKPVDLVHFKIRIRFSENLYAKLQPDAN